jgi:hypothetical protein
MVWNLENIEYEIEGSCYSPNERLIKTVKISDLKFLKELYETYKKYAQYKNSLEQIKDVLEILKDRYGEIEEIGYYNIKVGLNGENWKVGYIKVSGNYIWEECVNPFTGLCYKKTLKGLLIGVFDYPYNVEIPYNFKDFPQNVAIFILKFDPKSKLFKSLNGKFKYIPMGEYLPEKEGYYLVITKRDRKNNQWFAQPIYDKESKKFIEIKPNEEINLGIITYKLTEQNGKLKAVKELKKDIFKGLDKKARSLLKGIIEGKLESEPISFWIEKYVESEKNYDPILYKDLTEKLNILLKELNKQTNLAISTQNLEGIYITDLPKEEVNIYKNFQTNKFSIYYNI